MSDGVKIEVGSRLENRCPFSDFEGSTGTVTAIDGGRVHVLWDGAIFTCRYSTGMLDFLVAAPVAEPGPVADPCPVTELRSGWVDLVVAGVAKPVVSQQFRDSEALRSAPPRMTVPNVMGPDGVARPVIRAIVPAPAHDFSDPYCVRVNNMTGARSRRCKHCGASERRSTPDAVCVPDPNWRNHEDLKCAEFQRDRDSERSQSTPSRFQAPELRAAGNWACDMIRGWR